MSDKFDHFGGIELNFRDMEFLFQGDIIYGATWLKSCAAVSSNFSWNAVL